MSPSRVILVSSSMRQGSLPPADAGSSAIALGLGIEKWSRKWQSIRRAQSTASKAWASKPEARLRDHIKDRNMSCTFARLTLRVKEADSPTLPDPSGAWQGNPSVFV